MENKPFVHMLKTPLAKYAFDVNTNQLIQVNEELYDYLKKSSDASISSAAKKQLDFLTSHGYLSSKHPKKMKHYQSDLLEYQLNENVAQVTLQVTQQCNFRCSYCPYTTAEFDVQRKHNSNTMSYETAKAAVDFFAEHSANQNDVFVGFYGGEPLLEYDLIKAMVEYSEKIFKGKNLTFTVTTNGSLFTPENVKFFNEHNFNVMISLDGPPEVHDRSRKFAATGMGTFSVIAKNIQMIKEDFPEFFNKISFNIVIDPRYSCNDLHEMFNNSELFSDSNIRSTLIEDFFSHEKVISDEVYDIEQNIHEFKAYLSELGKYPKEKVSKIAYNNLHQNIARLNMSMQPQKTLLDTMSHSGPCIPGQRRLFIDVNGNFFPCERVSETSDAMKIGDLKNGFDFENARKILNVADLTEKQCCNCFAIRHCTTCAKYCDNNGELSAELKLSNCKNVRFNAEETFKNYLILKELKSV